MTVRGEKINWTNLYANDSMKSQNCGYWSDISHIFMEKYAQKPQRSRRAILATKIIDPLKIQGNLEGRFC